MTHHPMPPFPNSWFKIGWSDDFKRGGVQRLRYFGQDLVAFRSEAGQVHVLDAHCPHMGANLAVGGKVDGEALRCPFHGWKFNGSGACVHIPYADKIPPKARVRSWPVQEVNGLVFVYHHSEGTAPDFEIPALPEYGVDVWTDYYKMTWKIRMHMQEIVENAVDMPHFVDIHGFSDIPKLELDMDARSFRVYLKSRMTYLGLVVKTDLDIRYHGIGYSVTQTSKPLTVITQSCTTPIDDQYVEQTFSVMMKKRVNPIIRRLTLREIRRSFEPDIPIWENKRYYAQPVLAANDGPIMKVRKWCGQFYGPTPATRVALPMVQS